MPRYHVYGIVTGSRYLGEFEADNEEDAIRNGLESHSNSVSLCYHCSTRFELDDVSCQDAHAVEVK